MTNRQWGEMVLDLDEQLVRQMHPLRVMCPKCNNPKYTMVKGMTCSNCGKIFVAPDLVARARQACGFETPPPTGSIICPACNVDVIQYWRENRGKRRR